MRIWVSTGEIQVLELYADDSDLASENYQTIFTLYPVFPLDP